MFPSDIEQNPRDHCKAITLRSRKEVESSRQQEKKSKEVKGEIEVEVEKKALKVVQKSKDGISFLDNPPIITPPLPFP